MNEVQVASDILELADLCHWNKEQFANIADFILNRLLLVSEGKEIQRLRSSEELFPYIFQLAQAGDQLQPLSREDVYQAYLSHCDDPSLVDKLLGCDGCTEETTSPIFKNVE